MVRAGDPQAIRLPHMDRAGTPLRTVRAADQADTLRMARHRAEAQVAQVSYTALPDTFTITLPPSVLVTQLVELFTPAVVEAAVD